ncbi:MAG: DUF5685 family protein, partial [Coriobacteriales bacterium]|nr:DUF5685 family protein [Coriobacteriales bacterium]
MFGYIKPYKDEMRLRDIRRYQSAYCALCNRLKDDYGLLARLTLSYDITFLLISLNSFAGEPKEEGRFRCPLVPFWTKTSEITEVCLEYASFINYWLSIEKLNDDLRDGHSFTRRVLRDLLSTNKRYRSARTKYGQVADELGAMLESVYKLEGNASGCDDFDELTNMFGTFFASIFDMGGILGQLPRLSEPYRRLFF